MCVASMHCCHSSHLVLLCRHCYFYYSFVFWFFANRLFYFHFDKVISEMKFLNGNPARNVSMLRSTSIRLCCYTHSFICRSSHLLHKTISMLCHTHLLLIREENFIKFHRCFALLPCTEIQFVLVECVYTAHQR